MTAATITTAELEAFATQVGEPLERQGEFLHLHVGPDDWYARPRVGAL